jgi:hypothetical protein
VPYQRRLENSPPKKVPKKEFTPGFAPSRCSVPEEEMTLPFLVDGPADLDFVEVFLAFRVLVVVLANACRDVCAGLGACA